MKKFLQSLVLLLTVLSAATVAKADYVQLADGVYQDGTTLYIGGYVTSLGDLQVNPSVIYCYSAIPPTCVSNTFTDYGAALHVPSAAMVSYFSAQYWNYFNNIIADAISPRYVVFDKFTAELELGETMELTPTVYPPDATPTTIYWLSTNTAVATVYDGLVTAVGAGECDIIAACADKQAYCHVTVLPERVTITIDCHEARLLPNHTLKLNATCSPYAVDLAVTSSNPAVALPRLVNGTIMVVGIAEGTATITVNAADGWGNPDQCEVTVYTELGDVNSDGFVNIADVTSVIDYLLGDDTALTNADNADVNSDGTINIADVTELIDFLLNGYWPWEDPGDEHEWVDLGLPSGTLWATCNIGADSPEEYGEYFAWGETEPKEYYDWSTYKWCNGSKNTLTKYCTNSNYGTVDNKTELEPEDDAAYVNWGPSWRMPTLEQYKELLSKCYCIWSSNGFHVMGPNGNTLFLPNAGNRLNESINGVESCGRYWSRTLDNGSRTDRAYYLAFTSNAKLTTVISRDYGHSVRAVRVSQD